MQVFTDGYICITHAKGILQWRECIADILGMGGLTGILNQYFLLTWHSLHPVWSFFPPLSSVFKHLLI